ncbi:MAG: Na+/H+ antiporter NhaC family protein, partial [Limosilactobacillus fermentum]
IVPWSVSGVFIAATLQVNPLAFVPFAFFPFIVTILAVLMGFVKAKSAKEMAIN